MDPDPGGPKTRGSGFGSGSATLVISIVINQSNSQSCGSTFDLSPSCGSGCRLLFDADADQTFHLDLGCHHQIDADPDLFLDQAYHFDAGPDADPDFF